MDVVIAVPDLRDFVSDLRRVDARLPKVIQQANKEISVEVADAAQDRARGVSRQYAKAAKGISGRAKQKSASIAIRSARYPWIFGAEFGALAYRQFMPWRGNQWTQGYGPDAGTGYAVYPTIRDKVPEIMDTYGDRMMDALAAAYPERR
jgi:hypothetical protein